MKVAILTQPLGQNYGGLLQAYALQVYLKKIGCEVKTLDRREPIAEKVFVRNYVRNLKRLLRGRIKSMPTAKRRARILSELAAFREHKLAMTPPISSEQGIRDYFRSRDFDVFLVGSDQVWRPKYSPSILNFYLDFLNDIKSPAKRVAYAASFGVDDWEYTDELTEKCKDLAQQFHAVSVRENSAVGLCKDKLSVSAQWVVDPTLLLEQEDYDLLINECTGNKNTGCILSFVLDPNKDKRSVADTVANSLGVSVYSIKPEFSIAQVHAKDLEKCRFPSVESWLQGFREASFVVTDSFHGTVFSILFNKPFIAVGNSARGMARFKSLLSQFELLDRLVETSGEVTPELIQIGIDWDSVNSKRRALALEGQEFLKAQLFGK